MAVADHPASSSVAPLSRLAPALRTFAEPAVTLFIGGHVSTIKGESFDPGCPQMFTAAHKPANVHGAHWPQAALDSGAFTDRPERRLTAEAALERQLDWEQAASRRWGFWWRAMAFASYDLLIDETWLAGQRHKQRWPWHQAERAVETTVAAASFLASQRERLAPRALILSAQGVDAMQYKACAQDVLSVARPGDWFGLGGWCILGLQPSLLPVFWQTMHEVIPLVAEAGLHHVHIFGVLYEPALGPLVWLADQAGLTVSADSTVPLRVRTWQHARNGCYWRDNITFWQRKLADVRQTPYYHCPPRPGMARQLALDWGPAHDG